MAVLAGPMTLLPVEITDVFMSCNSRGRSFQVASSLITTLELPLSPDVLTGLIILYINKEALMSQTLVFIPVTDPFQGLVTTSVQPSSLAGLFT